MYRYPRLWALLLCLWTVLRRGASAADAPYVELRPRCPDALEGHSCEEGEFGSLGESVFKVDGRNVYINYMRGSYFEMSCDDATHSAELPALPRFREPVRVRRVLLRDCAPPALPYASALATLNVSVTEALLLHALPAAPPLRPDHFRGLGTLQRLELQGAARLPPAVLAPLPNLLNLALVHVQPGAALYPLPAALRFLRLWFTGTELVSLAGALKLQQLSVREENATFINVTDAPTLVSLTLSSPNSSVGGVRSLRSLVKLGIDSWNETKPKPWIQCPALEQLSLMNGASRQQMVLPDGWVARCSVLSDLSIRRVPLAALPVGLLGNATALKTLVMSGCRLTELPENLFNDAVQLVSLDLSYNRLETLSRDIFFSLRTLKTLNLSHNLLTASVAPALQPLSSLTELSLADNTRLTNLCAAGTEAIITIAGPSPLQQMTALTKLVLRNTSVSLVCQDWREGMPQLQILDLTDTNVTILRYEDVIQQRSIRGAKMKVGGRNYTIQFDYSSEDLKRARTESSTSSYVITLVRASVVCDCSAYWAALVFRVGFRHAVQPAPRCLQSPDTLRNVSLNTLTCAAPQLCGNLNGCSCVSRDDSQLSGGVATANCEGSGLSAVPGPLPRGPGWRLLLANNTITSVNASRLPSHLLEIDLRHNALETVGDAAASALLARRVWLAGNPLRCDCNALVLLRDMTAQPDHVDLKNITCAGGGSLPSPGELAAQCVGGGVPLAAALVVAALALAALVVATVLVRPEMRLRIKILLVQAGWVPRPGEGGDGGGAQRDWWQYDAFVSYAHEDEEWVRATLLPRLEGGAAPFRLCVHYRDWAPGEWIPAQISASVRNSRRTLAVVSKHFLKSDWARLEFREAQAQAHRDVTPRLIVLLLEEPELLKLDAEMRAFIQNNTYVRWDDPWFWKKLEHAMPRRPRAPTAPVAPPPHEKPQELQQLSRQEPAR